MIRIFRPWQIFERLNGNSSLSLQIPRVPGTESRTIFMLETALLVAAARIVKAQSILEIGTCYGYTAMHLAMNTDAVLIKSWDVKRRPQIWEGTPYDKKIAYGIVGEDGEISGPADMVFIDADHEYESVKGDTAIALAANPKLITWHDYHNPMEPGVMKALSEFAIDHNLIHVQDSWLAFWFREDLS